MTIRNVWGGTSEIMDDDDDDREPLRLEIADDRVKQRWQKKSLDRELREKRKEAFCVKLAWTILLVMVFVGCFVGLVVLVATQRSFRHRHHSSVIAPDNYTIALHQALMFFNAQRSGRLPLQNNVSWRGDSCLKDEVVGGYYDSGNAVKSSFPTSFAMTMLSWSVIEYGSKYDAAGELDHVKDIIKWGTDYLLKTSNFSAKSIGSIIAQIGGDHDENCWMRPEDIDSDDNYKRPATQYDNCPALASEMAAALAAASIVFRDNNGYSMKLVRHAEKLFKFATKDQGENYAGNPDPPSAFYNSSGFWDEFVWGGTWLYYATGNYCYLQLVTSPGLTRKDGTFWRGPNSGVLSWDRKHAGAQLLLSRLRIFLGYGYPYEEMLSKSHHHVEDIMCSYSAVHPNFSLTKGGLIQFNRGKPRPLQYAANAAFLATVYKDYLESKLIPGLQCGSKFLSNEDLNDFARGQINYILGKNPRNMSYVVGFGDHFPHQVHHRGSSIPNNNVKYGCKGGQQWRESQKPNPNIVIGAMVAGPDSQDAFKDIRSDSNYTEPTIAGNAGLVAALVALSGGRNSKIDKNTIFYAIPPLFTYEPHPLPPWTP